MSHKSFVSPMRYIHSIPYSEIGFINFPFLPRKPVAPPCAQFSAQH